MKLTITIIAAAIGWSAPMAAPAAAQDVQPYSESLNDSARQVRERMLRDATVNRHRGTAPRRGISAATRRTCADRRRAAAKYGRNHPDIRQLYALCARAGL